MFKKKITNLQIHNIKVRSNISLKSTTKKKIPKYIYIIKQK